MENKNPTPKHVAIILDGNRRYAKKLMLEPWHGHEFGKKKVEELMDYSKELGLKELTFYALSIENLNSRPKKEIEHIFNIFENTFNNLDMDKLKKDKVNLNFLGELNLLPENIRNLCNDLKEKTKNNSGFKVNFCIAYGGRQEIIKAIKEIIDDDIKSSEINENIMTKYLELKEEPEIVIRTGGEIRTSNFLPWQTTYSEWFFIPKMWPEFEKQDLVEIINEYKHRKRNFGK